MRFGCIGRDEVEAKGVNDEENGAFVGQMEGARRTNSRFLREQATRRRERGVGEA